MGLTEWLVFIGIIGFAQSLQYLDPRHKPPKLSRKSVNRSEKSHSHVSGQVLRILRCGDPLPRP